MNRFGISTRSPAIVILPALAFLVFSSCGSGIGDLAGGGTGGTGISTGAVTGFGSVAMNGAHYQTDGAVAPGFITKKIAKGMDKSNAKDRDLFRVGMVVTIHHSPNDNNAMEIVYEPNIEGPIAAKIPGPNPTIVVLGLTVVLDDPAFFASLGQNNVVEVSGFVDNAGLIRATHAEVNHPAPMPGDLFEVKGFLSGLNPSDNTFRLGPLPDGSGATVTVSYAPDAIQSLPSGPANGMHVKVMTADLQPASGTITSTDVQRFAARTDFPENATVDLDGLVTKLKDRSGNTVSFELEGKAVRTDGSTVFVGGTATDISPNARVQVQGKENSGVLNATGIILR